MSIRQKSGTSGWYCGSALSALLLAFFALLEWLRPYYFLQDDNRDFYLCLLAHNWRALKTGTIALFNFNQFLGIPFLAAGQTGALYPPAYAAAAASSLFLGHGQGAVDIYIIFHLIIAGAAMRAFLLENGAGEKNAFFGGLSWGLNAFPVFMSSNGLVTSAASAWLPIILLFAGRTLRGGVSAAVWLTLARLALFYNGYPQYFVETLLTELGLAIAGIAFCRKVKIGGEAVKLYLASYAATIVFALPLLLPMLHQMTISADRARPLRYAAFHNGPNRFILWLQGLVWPASGEWFLRLKGPLAAVLKNRCWLDFFLPSLSHAGIIAVPLVVFALAARRPGNWTPHTKKALLLLLIALGWSLGFFDRAIYLLPVLNRFRYPYKLLFFANFAFVWLAALGLEAALEHPVLKKLLPALIAITLLNFGLLYMWGPKRQVMQHRGAVPVPSPAAGLGEGRVAAFGTGEEPPDGFAALLGFDYGTLFNIPQIAGYETLLPKNNSDAVDNINTTAVITVPPQRMGDFIPYLRLWGVRYYFVDNRKVAEFTGRLTAAGIRQKNRDADKTVFEDPSARPTVYWQDAPLERTIQSVTGINDIHAQTVAHGERVVVFNVMYNPFFRAEINGEETPVLITPDNQPAIELPPGQNSFILRYRDPYFNAGLLIAILAAGACALIFLKRKTMPHAGEPNI